VHILGERGAQAYNGAVLGRAELPAASRSSKQICAVRVQAQI